MVAKTRLTQLLSLATQLLQTSATLLSLSGKYFACTYLCINVIMYAHMNVWMYVPIMHRVDRDQWREIAGGGAGRCIISVALQLSDTSDEQR